MDTLQLNKSKNGYTYILLLCEEFSGYIVATPLKTLQAAEAVKALRNLFSPLLIEYALFRMLSGSLQALESALGYS